MWAAAGLTPVHTEGLSTFVSFPGQEILRDAES